MLWLSYPVRIGLFCFSYGDYSFGRALKTTVGSGKGEAAGLKDRINQRRESLGGWGGLSVVVADERLPNLACWLASASGNKL